MNCNSINRYFAITVLLIGLILMAPVSGQDQTGLTKADVDATINTAGRTMPDWWESVELNYPQTLDMNWPVQQQISGFGRGGRGGRRGRGGQQFNQNASMSVDDYLFQVIYPNQSKYKSGIKLVNHLMIRHKDDQDKLKRSLNTLGNLFYELMGDHARAAFWWQKYSQMGGTFDAIKMAQCYFELGSKSAAEELLSQVGENGASNKDLIKLWAQIGEVDKALQLIQDMPANGRMGRGGGSQEYEKNLLSGEICRAAGRYDEAIAFYQKIIDASANGQPRRGRGLSVEARAQNNLAATKLIKNLDLSKVPDGSYTAETQGYGGPLTVKVDCKAGKIVSVDITQHRETAAFFMRALPPTTQKILANQGFQGIHGITGATISSDAIIHASAKALSEAKE